MARKLRVDMAGIRFGRLVGLGFAHRDASGHAHWRFRCDCGVELVADGGNVRSGNTTSCGCLHRERSAARLTVHGHRANRRHDPSYRAWQQMNDQCANPASLGWARHGGQGVRVAERWRADYPAFLADLGERPAGTVLRRIADRGDFAPGNCGWVAAPARAMRPRATVVAAAPPRIATQPDVPAW